MFQEVCCVDIVMKHADCCLLWTFSAAVLLSRLVSLRHSSKPRKTFHLRVRKCWDLLDFFFLLKKALSFFIWRSLNINETRFCLFFLSPPMQILTIYFRSGSRVKQYGDNGAKKPHKIHFYMFTRCSAQLLFKNWEKLNFTSKPGDSKTAIMGMGKD